MQASDRTGTVSEVDLRVFYSTPTIYKKMSNGRFNKIPFTDCQDCWKKNNSRPKRENNQRHREPNDASAISFAISIVQVGIVNGASSASESNIIHNTEEPVAS